MSKLRVYELAKQFDMKGAEMAELLRSLGFAVKGHMSTLDALTGRNMDVGEDAAIERDDVAETRGVDLESADNRLLATLEDADDPALGSSLGVALDAGDNPVAVHRLGQIRGGDKDVLSLSARFRMLGHDKPEPAWICLEVPDHQIHLLRDAKAVATNLEKCSLRHQRLELPLETATLLARHAQQLSDFTRGGGMMHAVTYEPQDVVVRKHLSTARLCQPLV